MDHFVLAVYLLQFAHFAPLERPHNLLNPHHDLLHEYNLALHLRLRLLQLPRPLRTLLLLRLGPLVELGQCHVVQLVHQDYMLRLCDLLLDLDF